MVRAIMVDNRTSHKPGSRLQRLSCCTAAGSLQCGNSPFARVRKGLGSPRSAAPKASPRLGLLVAAALALSGCGAASDLVAGYQPPESAAVPDGPWPKLAEQDFSAPAPNPAAGGEIADALTIAATAAAARAEALAAPVMTEAEAKRLRDAGRRSR